MQTQPGVPQADLLVPTEHGMYCAAGDFYVDPWRAVKRAVITHAHSDHAAWGCESYLCSPACEHVLRQRLGAKIVVQSAAYGERVRIGTATMSLHPAGHILGSAQVRVEVPGAPVWVLSGDYKVAPDATCEPFEPVQCDVFVTESTFGLPIYRWRPESELFSEIKRWWADNAAMSRTSVILAYSLGKAQRVLHGLDAGIGPIAVHGAVHAMNGAYARAGVRLPDAAYATPEIAKQIRGKGLVIAPPSALGSPWIRKFADPEGGFSAATVSGWMRVRGSRRRQAIDRGFVVSDHADWPGLLGAIRATGASRVGVTHGYVPQMVRWLRESGLDAFVVPTRYKGEAGESETEGEAGEVAAREEGET